jgi:4-diphosphocytidyl-2-C-methyl-D-erythritol kinase
MKTVRLPAYAKVNLCLEVLRRCADGYHELRTIFQAISLHDTLRLEACRGPEIELRITGDSGLAGEPASDNLVYRAIEGMRRELRWRTGVRAILIKRIPVGRGLGGGSSDAAAALLGMLQLTGKRVDPTRLVEIAAGLGSDVPFFLFGGRALGVGRGSQIYPLPDTPRRTILVISPRGISVSTREAYRWLEARLTNRSDASRLFRFCALCWSPLGEALANDFERAVFRRHPRLSRIKGDLLRHGAADAALAGSGSAVFGVFQNPAQARRAARAFPNDQWFVCSTLSEAEYRRRLGGPAFA